ncbi:hypothetical protein KFE80_00360 [bacterium SCSIO 12696]|nr:hypothetical protein KFE80_00360 [bacterium SCSIO 12696]
MDLNFQYAHHAHSESETTKNVVRSQAEKAFDDFDWVAEAKKADELQKCSPTLTILTNGDKELIWVSAYTNGSTVGFVSECRFPSEVSKWFGLSKKQGTVSLDTDGFSIEQAKRAISLFLDRNFISLREMY